MKTWETDEDDLDNASDKKKKKVEKDSWRLDGRGKVKILNTFLYWRQRKQLVFFFFFAVFH